jgi:alpha-N-arabinofuranosidase
MNRACSLLALVITAGSLAARAADVPTLTVRVDQPGGKISPLHTGLFFEDINFAADGGLYPERIKNGSFEFDKPLMAWKEVARNNAAGSLDIANDNPLHPNNPHHLRLTVKQPGDGFGLENEGFRGIGVTRDAAYTFSLFAHCADPNPPALKIELIGHDGQLLATSTLRDVTADWKKHSVEIQSSATDAHARLAIVATAPGTLDLDMISLLPKDTFNNHGLRPDLGQLLKDMKPGFLRFPGGCIVEGRTLALRYRWKDTIGPLESRKLLINRWNNEFKHRPTPDYYQSFGLGFYEYFQLCEDIGAKPLPVLNCGMACQFNTGELCPMDKLDQYVQDALDLIEFANGSPDSAWGAKRAAMGHPQAFNLDLLGVGNEQWGPQYIERYEVFHKAIKAKYPNIRLVSGAGPSPQGKDFDFAWKRLRELNADIVDEHYYKEPAWFPANVHRYDNYPRTGPKVFAGEFAAQSVKVVSPDNRNDWNTALSEAAFMTGLERNADVVVMASYAPLFAHVDAWQWTPNLIWFDNLRSYGTPNYYVQKLFAIRRPAVILPATFAGESTGLFACAISEVDGGDYTLKIVNTRATAVSLTINLQGATHSALDGTVQILSHADLKAENSLDRPTNIAPKEAKLPGLKPTFTYDVPAHSLNVLSIPAF